MQKYLRNETSEEELVEVLDWLDASTENQRYLYLLDYFSILHQYNTIRIYDFIRMMCDQDNRHSLFLIQFFYNIYYLFS